MKLDFSFLETSKNRVTRVTRVTPADDAACIGNPSKNERVTRVTPADDAACIGNPSKNERVTRVTFSETPGQEVTQVTQVKTVGLPTKPANDAEVTQVTQVKTVGLPTKPANDAEVTQVTQVTHKNIETEKENEADRPEPMALLQARGEVETCPAIVAPAMPETNAAQGAVALHCSDDDKALLAETVAMLTDEFIRVAPGNADQLIRAFNTVEAAERAGDQESFNFALNVLRSVVDDARQLAPGETCGGVAYG